MLGDGNAMREMEELWGLARSIGRSLKPPPNLHQPQKVEAVLGYIHRHLCEVELTVQQACHQCGIRDHNITTRFRLTLGRGIREYIEMHRILTAQELLLKTSFAIYLVAFAVGYSHQESFTRAFRRQTGQNPSSWKAAARQPPVTLRDSALQQVPLDDD